MLEDLRTNEVIKTTKNKSENMINSSMNVAIMLIEFLHSFLETHYIKSHYFFLSFPRM